MDITNNIKNILEKLINENYIFDKENIIKICKELNINFNKDVLNEVGKAYDELMTNTYNKKVQEEKIKNEKLTEEEKVQEYLNNKKIEYEKLYKNLANIDESVELKEEDIDNDILEKIYYKTNILPYWLKDDILHRPRRKYNDDDQEIKDWNTKLNWLQNYSDEDRQIIFKHFYG